MISERDSCVRETVSEAKKIKKTGTVCKPDDTCHRQTFFFTAK